MVLYLSNLWAWAYLMGEPGGHVPPKFSGPESCWAQKMTTDMEKMMKNRERNQFLLISDGLLSAIVHLIMFFWEKKIKKTSKQGDILSGPKCHWAHIDLCPSNSDVIKYAPVCGGRHV